MQALTHQRLFTDDGLVRAGAQPFEALTFSNGFNNIAMTTQNGNKGMQIPNHTTASTTYMSFTGFLADITCQ